MAEIRVEMAEIRVEMTEIAGALLKPISLLESASDLLSTVRPD